MMLWSALDKVMFQTVLAPSRTDALQLRTFFQKVSIAPANYSLALVARKLRYEGRLGLDEL